MAILQETGQALVNPLINLWNSFVDALPGIIGAIIVLILGYIVGAVIGAIVTKVLEKARLDQLIYEKTSLKQVAGQVKISDGLGILAKWYIFILFLSPAATLLNLPALSGIISEVAIWLPNLIAAVLIGLIGLIIADYVHGIIKRTSAKSAILLAGVTKIIIIIFVAMIALKQLGINLTLAENSLLIIVAGVMLALAIGFGLALKDQAKPIIKDLLKRL